MEDIVQTTFLYAFFWMRIFVFWVRCVSGDFSDGWIKLDQVMAWSHQATSHYLIQCWSRSTMPRVGNFFRSTKDYSKSLLYYDALKKTSYFTLSVPCLIWPITVIVRTSVASVIMKMYMTGFSPSWEYCFNSGPVLAQYGKHCFHYQLSFSPKWEALFLYWHSSGPLWEELF